MATSTPAGGGKRGASTTPAAKAAEPVAEAPQTVAPDKTELMTQLVAKYPEGVIAPTQPFLTITEGLRSFYLGAFESTREVNETTGYETTFELRPRTRRMRGEIGTPDGVTTYRLDSLPTWTYEQIYDLLEGGTCLLFESAEEATPPARVVAPGVIDHESTTLFYELRASKGTGGGRERRFVLEPTLAFANVEQEIAHTILNGVVDGEKPLPKNVATSPMDVSAAEVEIVRSRIARALANPASFCRTAPQKVRIHKLLAALVSYEYSGQTPNRSDKNPSALGGTRPALINLYTHLAQAEGLAVIGDYVYPKQFDPTPSVPGETYTLPAARS